MVAIIVLAGSLEETILYSEYSLNRRKSVAITKMTVFSFIRVLRRVVILRKLRRPRRNFRFLNVLHLTT